MKTNIKPGRHCWPLFHGVYVPRVTERDTHTKQANKEIKPFPTVIGAVKKMKQNDVTENTGSRARGKEIPDWVGGRLSKKYLS